MSQAGYELVLCRMTKSGTGGGAFERPRSSDENSRWNGRPEDETISSCNLVVSLAKMAVKKFSFSL